MVCKEPYTADPDSGKRGEYIRVELRNPDPSANPYLALAVCLAAGLDGIKQGLMPPKAVNRNVYEMTDEERKIFGIEKLPGSLREAAIEFQKDTFIQEILGEDLSKNTSKQRTASIMSIESRSQTGNLKNICTYCNTILHLTEMRKRVSDRRWQSDRDYCCIPE